MAVPDLEKQVIPLAQASTQQKERSRMEMSMCIVVPVVFLSLISVVCYFVRAHVNASNS